MASRAERAMLLYRIVHPTRQAPCHALLQGERLIEVPPPLHAMIDRLHAGPDRAAALDTGGDLGRLEDVRLLAPSAPSKVVCVGLNYRRHAEEMGKAVPDEPLIFLKPSTTVIATEEAIVLPAQSSEVHHEGELALVIGKTATRLDERQAADVVLGYTCGNDVTARDIQRREQRYTRAKGFDSFCPLGPALALAPAFSPEHRRLVCRVNGQVRQSSSLDDFIFSIPRVISFISHVMTLLPGDVIMTGTPAGVGPIQRGDMVEVEIEGIGTLRSPVH